jgi:hypothetical protein
MSSGDIAALKMQGDLLQNTMHLGRAYFKDLSLSALGKLKHQIHIWITSVNYMDDEWKMLSCVKSFKQAWTTQDGRFWLDIVIKILIAMGLIASNAEHETRDYLQRQSTNNRAIAWGLACCFDEYILIQEEAGPFAPWLRINLPNRITTAVREVEQKGRNGVKGGRKGGNDNDNNNGRKGPYNRNGKGHGQNNKGAKKGGGKKGGKKGKKGAGKKGNSWNNNNNWGSNNWGGNNDWNPNPNSNTTGNTTGNTTTGTPAAQ